MPVLFIIWLFISGALAVSTVKALRDQSTQFIASAYFTGLMLLLLYGAMHS